jgi:hypothetical protein
MIRQDGSWVDERAVKPGKETAGPHSTSLRAGSPLRYALSKNIPKKEPPNRRSLHCAPPDFLWRPVALRICMRLSLRRAAQVDVASSAK